MTIQRGEIYFVDLNPVQGREQAGQRPVLVVSSNAINRLPLVVTVVVGTKGENVRRDYPTNVRVSPVDSGLRLETVFMCFQLRSIDPNRFSSAPAGQVSEEVMQKIEDAIRYCLDLDEEPKQS
jgi:mRNA interferase MazF